MSESAVTSCPHGLLIAFEGVEGSGKSTQARRLALRLTEYGHEVVLTREPGGTPLAERIRCLLLDQEEGSMGAMTELFLYLAGRAEHVQKLVSPALARGCHVVCDRFALASVAYQGAARNLGTRWVEELCRYATGGLWPDLTVLLDLDPEVGLVRKHEAGFNADRLEREDLAFHRCVREAYLAWGHAHPEQILVLDARLQVDELEMAVWQGLAERIRRAPST